MATFKVEGVVKFKGVTIANGGPDGVFKTSSEKTIMRLMSLGFKRISAEEEQAHLESRRVSTSDEIKKAAKRAEADKKLAEQGQREADEKMRQEDGLEPLEEESEILSSARSEKTGGEGNSPNKKKTDKKKGKKR